MPEKIIPTHEGRNEQGRRVLLRFEPISGRFLTRSEYKAIRAGCTREWGTYTDVTPIAPAPLPTRKSSMSSTVYSVHPRHTPGSPAQVDPKTADRVARNEISAWVDSQRGAFGIELRQNGYPKPGSESLRVDGLREVVIAYLDENGWRHIYDVITGESWSVRLRDVNPEHPWGPPATREGGR